jgi:hypothetical protein
VGVATLGPGVTTRYRLVVTGPVSQYVTETIAQRFGEVSIRREAAGTVLELACADQPALRAVLTLLWDAGHDVRHVCVLDRADPEI